MIACEKCKEPVRLHIHGEAGLICPSHVRQRLIALWSADDSLQVGVPYRRMASDVVEALSALGDAAGVAPEERDNGN